MDTDSQEVIKEGWMRKKTGRVNLWGERYFLLKGGVLYYYLKATDTVSCTDTVAATYHYNVVNSNYKRTFHTYMFISIY